MRGRWPLDAPLMRPMLADDKRSRLEWDQGADTMKAKTDLTTLVKLITARIGRRASLALLATPLVLALGLAPTGTAQAEKVLIIAQDSNTPNFDPAAATQSSLWNIHRALFSSLVQVANDGSLQPELALGWEASPDLRTWTFNLRPGVKFHHGRELDAEDVVATIERVMDADTGSPAHGLVESFVASVEAMDTHTVRFNLNLPYGEFPGVLSHVNLRIIARDKVDALASHPIGSGAFKFVEFVPNERTVMERHSEYWEPGVPKVDRVVWRIIPDKTVALTALEAGEVHMTYDPNIELRDRVRSHPDLVLDEIPANNWMFIEFNTSIPPFDDIRVRKAFMKMIDKRELMEIAVFGEGIPTHSPIHPNSPYYNDELAIPGADPESARRLLAEAGHPDGLEVDVNTIAGWTEYERLGLGLREAGKAAGFRISVKPSPFDKFVSEIEGVEPLSLGDWFGQSTADLSVFDWFHSKGSWTDILMHWKNAESDALLDEARLARDDAERTRLYKAWQEFIVTEDFPGIVVYAKTHANAASKSVIGFRSSPTFLIDVRNVDLAE